MANWGFCDAAKGIGITLVVLGHAKSPFTDLIYSFHMPLFFFLMGYLNDFAARESDFFRTARGRAARLLRPYFAACCGFYVFWLLAARHFGQNAAREVEAVIPLIGIFYASGHGDWLIFNTPLWYLPCAFCSHMVFFGLSRLCRGRTACFKLLAASLLSVMGYFLSWFVYLPWGADIALVAQFFLCCGHMMRTRGCFDQAGAGEEMRAAGFWLIVFLILYSFNSRVDMNQRQYGNFALFLFTGISGALFAMYSAKIIDMVRYLPVCMEYLGRRTIIILVFHLFGFKLVSLAGVYLFSQELGNFQKEYWHIYAASGVVLPLSLDLVWTRLWAAGKDMPPSV